MFKVMNELDKYGVDPEHLPRCPKCGEKAIEARMLSTLPPKELYIHADGTECVIDYGKKEK
jgi:hypothetical protein